MWKKVRRPGGIEPLSLSAPTGLKPAPNTSQVQFGIGIQKCGVLLKFVTCKLGHKCKCWRVHVLFLVQAFANRGNSFPHIMLSLSASSRRLKTAWQQLHFIKHTTVNHCWACTKLKFVCRSVNLHSSIDLPHKQPAGEKPNCACHTEKSIRHNGHIAKVHNHGHIARYVKLGPKVEHGIQEEVGSRGP